MGQAPSGNAGRPGKDQNKVSKVLSHTYYVECILTAVSFTSSYPAERPTKEMGTAIAYTSR